MDIDAKTLLSEELTKKGVWFDPHPDYAITIDIVLPDKGLAILVEPSKLPYYMDKLPKGFTDAFGQTWGLQIIYIKEDDILKDVASVVNNILRGEKPNAKWN